MARPEFLTLCWNGRPLGRITEIVVNDWPWASGRLAVGEWPPGLWAAVEDLARDVDDDEEDSGEDEPRRPSYPPGCCSGWSVVDPAGESLEIGVPKVDFAGGEIDWR